MGVLLNGRRRDVGQRAASGVDGRDRRPVTSSASIPPAIRSSRSARTGLLYYANIVFSRVAAARGIVVSTSTRRRQDVERGQPREPTRRRRTSSTIRSGSRPGPDGKVVVAWTRFNLGPQGAGYRESPIVGAFSKDGGRTWNRQSFPISDAAHPFDQGSQVQYGPDGALYVSYEAASPTTGYKTDAVVLARSTDDGKSFETKELARVYDDPTAIRPSPARQTLTDMHFRLNSLPSMSIDPSNGRIAIVWTDDQGAGNCGFGRRDVHGDDLEPGQAPARDLVEHRHRDRRAGHADGVTRQGVSLGRRAQREDRRDLLHA